MNGNDLTAIDRQIARELGDGEHIYDNRSPVLAIVDVAVPYADEDGSVLGTMNECRILNDGVHLEPGKKLVNPATGKAWTLQKYLGQDGEFLRWEIV